MRFGEYLHVIKYLKFSYFCRIPLTFTSQSALLITLTFVKSSLNFRSDTKCSIVFHRRREVGFPYQLSTQAIGRARREAIASSKTRSITPYLSMVKSDQKTDFKFVFLVPKNRGIICFKIFLNNFFTTANFGSKFRDIVS
jgi:hypothetical protein